MNALKRGCRDAEKCLISSQQNYVYVPRIMANVKLCHCCYDTSDNDVGFEKNKKKQNTVWLQKLKQVYVAEKRRRMDSPSMQLGILALNLRNWHLPASSCSPHQWIKSSASYNHEPQHPMMQWVPHFTSFMFCVCKLVLLQFTLCFLFVSHRLTSLESFLWKCLQLVEVCVHS